MNIKDVKVGGIYYLPIKVKSVVSEDFNDICITDENGDQWNEYDAAEMVTSADIVKAINEKMDDQVDFWKRDSESAHEEIRKLQEQVKRLEDSNSQYAEQIQKYDNALNNAQDKVAAKIEQLAKSEKRCAYLQTKLESLNNINNEAERYKGLSETLRKRVEKLEADKARPVCIAVNDVETPKVKALSKALREQGQVIRQKNATINALAERVVYLEGEMKKNG